MGAHGGPEIITDGLEQVWDRSNIKSFRSGDSTWKDPITKRSGGPGNPDWANNIDEITIMLLLRVDGTNQAYAYHPVSKWNSSYRHNASFILYHFQEYEGRTWWPRLTWYGNRTAENSSGWGGIAGGSFYTDPNNMYLVGLQRNATNGGQMWINGNKIGGRGGAGLLGQTSINSSTGNIGIDGGPTGRGGIHAVEWLAFWSRELSDDEMRKVYYSKKGKIDAYYSTL